MAKIKVNDIIQGVMWGIVIHVGLTVVLPRLKTVNLQNIFSQFNVQGQTETETETTPPTTTTEDQDENEPPPEEEEEGITPAPGEGDSEEDEDYEEEVPSDEEQIRMGEEMGFESLEDDEADAGVARGRRRTRGIGEDNIMAEYANRIRV